jgi:DNA-binding NarL/FixJ family response regulator
VRSTRADVVLLDVRMPKKGGLEVLEEMRALEAPPPAILLTTFDDDAVALAGIKLGARGFLLKDVSLEQLAGAIRTVGGGGTVHSPTVTERVLRGIDRIAPAFEASALPEPLTKREREVLRLMAAGSSNKEIANALGAAEGTIKNHASTIFSKLGVRDRTRAVLKGLELGII